jgi:spore maturation protein SpmA
VNAIFLAIVAIAFLVGAFTGGMEAVSASAFAGAKSSVELAISLIGYMALFLGLMKVAEEGGLLRLLAKAIRPIMVRLFPDVPPEHPAMGAMIMNIAANMMGLTNAATPLGIKAMKELNSLSRTPGVATNAMVLFLAINTSGLALLPSGVVSVRAAEGSADPWGIVASTLAATGTATIIGIGAAKLFSKFFPMPQPTVEEGAAAEPDDVQVGEITEDTWGVWVLRAFLVVVMFVLAGPPLLAVAWEDQAELLRGISGTIGDWVIPTLILSLLAFGAVNGVKVYEAFVKGAREGFDTGVLIIPYLVAILVAVGMFRGSGAMEHLTGWMGIVTDPMGLPPEVLPQAMVRPLSGSGAYGLMIELVQTHGPDSYIGYLSTTLQGSTDTTFYVLAVYFGAVGVSKTRHAVLAGLSADFAGFIAAVVVCALLFGHLT